MTGRVTLHAQEDAVGETANPSSSVAKSNPTGEVPVVEPAVRFNSKLQEIEPAHSLQTGDTLTGSESREEEPLTEEAEAELRELSVSLQNSPLQHRRLSNFAFEPVSLPVSRVSKVPNQSVSFLAYEGP